MATKPLVSEETKRVLAGRQAAFTSLTQHPSWPELVAEVERRAEALKQKLMHDALAGNAHVPPISQREFDYNRGFINGMQYLLAVCNGAEERLERYLQEQAKKARIDGRRA